MLRVVFIGDYEMGAAVLGGLLDSSHTLLGVVHRMPDKGAMRLRRRLWNAFSPDDTARIVGELGLEVLTSKGANSEEFRSKVAELAPDVILMSSWGEILRGPTIGLPKLACINCHTSLLPAHRGVNPFASVIVEGEKKTGVTFHLVSGKIDAGAVLLQREIDIAEDDTPSKLRAKCAYKAKGMVGELLDRLERGDLSPVAQDESKASYFEPYSEEDGAIDWTRPARELHNLIRGLTPAVACRTGFNGRPLAIGSSCVIGLKVPSSQPGQVLGKCGNSLLVSTGDSDHGLLIEVVDDVKTVGFFNKWRAQRFIDRKIRLGSLVDFGAHRKAPPRP